MASNNWYSMSLRRKAEFLLDQIDGITEDDIDDIYEEWSDMTFDRSMMGYDESLSALWRLAYNRSIRNMGRSEAQAKRINEEIRRKGLE